MPSNSQGSPIGSPSRQKQNKSPPRTPPTPRADEKRQRTNSPERKNSPKHSPKSPKPALGHGLAPLDKPKGANFFEGDYLVYFDKDLLNRQKMQYEALTSGEPRDFSTLPTYEDVFRTNCDMYFTTEKMIVRPKNEKNLRELWAGKKEWLDELHLLDFLSEDGNQKVMYDYYVQLVRLMEQIKWEVYHIRRDPINFQRFATLPGPPDRMSHRDRRLYVADLLIADFNIIARIAKDYADVDN